MHATIFTVNVYFQVNSKGLVEILSPADHDLRSLQHVPLKDTWSASFHRDGHRNVAIGTKSGNVLIWDTKNKTITKTFPSPVQQSSVDHVSFNAKNASLAATMHNGDTVIYGLVSNIPVLTVKLPCSKSIAAMKFHHESRALLGLATDEGHLVLRDITTNRDKCFFENVHAAPVSDFVYSHVNKDVMLSCGFDKVMHVYDIRLQNVVSTIRTSYILTSLAINSDNLVALGSKNGVIIVYDLRDLSNPFKILSDHVEEVRTVAFQPERRKTYSTEISLKDDTEVNLSPFTTHTPIRERNSDMFYVSDTPPNKMLDVSGHGDPRADSFLVMMGLDKSNNALDEESKSVCFEKNEKLNSDQLYYNCDQDKNMSKMSTPINNKVAENLGFSSPIFPTNVVLDDGLQSHVADEFNQARNNHQLMDTYVKNIDTKAVEELKDFVKLTMADVADDNRNYFLHIMMALTKQKLFLEKQLTGMNEQIKALIQNQSALVETNRKLAFEIDQLKSPKHVYRIQS